MMKKRLYIYAPNDRFNYGDLLFPYVLTFYFRSHFDDIVYVSTSESNLSNKGGLPTVSYKSLYNVDPNWENHLIVAGGECLCVRWNSIMSYVKPWVAKTQRFVLKLSRLFGPYVYEIFEYIIKKIYNTKTYFAFSVGKNELPHFSTIVYNSLGGCNLMNSGFLKSETVRDILKSVDIISVRDEETSFALNQFNIKNTISPDSAIIMSDVFSEEQLQSHLTINKADFADKYIFFQGNLGTWYNNYDLAVREIKKIHTISDAKVCLCPIGTALGHGDDIALLNIFNRLVDKDRNILIMNPNIFDIMWLIKHSNMYVGTSLHGVITAMSFGRPFVGYGSKKQKVFIQKWAQGINNISTADNLAYSIEHNVSAYDYSYVKEKVYEMFSIYLKLYSDN